MKSLAVFVVFVLLSFSAAAIGSFSTRSGTRDWYPTLRKPSWTPPDRVFGPVWTVLYVCIATAGFLVWRNAPAGGATLPMVFFAVQLLLNAAWSWVFFGLRQPGWALAELTLLWLAIAATTLVFFRICFWSGLLFVPYLLWVTFAGVLNFAIWRANA